MSELPTDFLQLLLSLESLHTLQSTIVRDTSLPSATSALPTLPTNPTPQKRCGACKHKLLLSDMPCRCGIRHCSTHRLPETHSCTFDHGSQDRNVLESQLIKCVADKLGDRIGH